jgi:lysozyme
MRRVLAIAVLLAACGPDAEHPGVERGALPSDALTTCAPGTTLKGIDVSHYDGTIDWAAYAASGRPFAIAKATEGVTFTDPQFATNWAGMKSAGLVRGAYHFFHPRDDGAQQARFFLSKTGALGPGDLPPILDWEATDSVSNAAAWQSAQDFVDAVKAQTGLTTIVYSSARFLGTIGNPTQFSALPLWDAQYNVTCPNIPAAWTTWAFWQTTGTAAGVPGTNGAVDANLFNGDLTALLALTAPAPAVDAGTPDAGSVDAGEVDAGSLDAGGLDAGDAGSADAGDLDAGDLPDAGVDPGHDAGVRPGPPPAASAAGCSTDGAGAPAALLLLLLAYFVPRRWSQISMPRRG